MKMQRIQTLSKRRIGKGGNNISKGLVKPHKDMGDVISGGYHKLMNACAAEIMKKVFPKSAADPDKKNVKESRWVIIKTPTI